NFLRQLGGALGIGLVGNVLEWRLRAHPGAALTAYHETFALIGVITACAVIAAMRMGSHRPVRAA
ncbi:MAG: MFS transporter, partial [Caldimonas sp.]